MEDVRVRIKSTVSNMSLTEEEKKIMNERLLAILSYWGNGTLDTDKKGYLGLIRVNVFNQFGLSEFTEKVLGYSRSENDDENEIENEKDPKDNILPAIEPTPIVNKAFEDFERILLEWHYDKKNFIKAYQVRDALEDFIISNLQWQQEGVSLLDVKMIKDSSYHLVEIERQDKGVNKGLVLLKDNDETYQILLSIGKSWYLGKKRGGNKEYASWDFAGASSCIRIATSWLERNKQIFINVVKGFSNKIKTPNYLKCSMIAEVYRGVLNGDYQVNRVSDIKSDFYLKNNELRKVGDLTGHSKEWCNLVNDIIYVNNNAGENIELIQRYYNIIQGKQANATRKIISYNLLDDNFKELRSDSFDIDINNIEEDKIKARNVPKDYLKKILAKVNIAIEAECKEGMELYKEIISLFGFSEGSDIEADDIKELLNEIVEFYKDVEMNGVIIQIKIKEALMFKDKAVDISKAFTLISKDMTNKSTLDKVIAYSKNPMKILKRFIGFLRNVDEDRRYVYSEMLAAKEALTRSGNWTDDVDPRFDDNKSEFVDLMNLLED